mgnify:CR=1 FL=1|jgi:hypothetical protein
MLLHIYVLLINLHVILKIIHDLNYVLLMYHVLNSYRYVLLVLSYILFFCSYILLRNMVMLHNDLNVHELLLPLIVIIYWIYRIMVMLTTHLCLSLIHNLTLCFYCLLLGLCKNDLLRNLRLMVILTLFAFFYCSDDGFDMDIIIIIIL